MKEHGFVLLLCTLMLGQASIRSCSSQADSQELVLSQLAVTWRLIENTMEDNCVAEFRFTHHGKAELDAQNWALYFNQNTLQMAGMPPHQLGSVEHVNGDLYRFIPGKAFKLAPRDTLAVSYSYDGHLIKESHTPAGAYIVLNPGESEESVVLPSSFQTAPFPDLEKLFPDPELRSKVPTAASRYIENLRIEALSMSGHGKIVPTPTKEVQVPGKVELNNKTLITYHQGLENEARLLAAKLRNLFGLDLELAKGASASGNAILLGMAPLRVDGISEEAYSLSVQQGSPIQITGSDEAGVFYGVQSLVSLLWADQESSRYFVKCIEIQDAPRFSYRGFLLDVSRNFQQKNEVLRLIDLLSSYKINKLNIRISEDEGWRIEIDGLPELTQVGSMRGHTLDSKNCLPPSFGSGPFPYSENNHGSGYYSRDDFKEILKYAAQRHIQVIPEVCFPSHARAAMKAMEVRYDFYMERNDPVKANEFRLTDPNDNSKYLSPQLYKDNIACVALPSTYHFYETVIKDFLAMYEEAGLTMTVFNTGGDEVPSGAWTGSPLCLELIKELPDVNNARQLQAYFLEKVIAICEKYKLQVNGWEEIVLNKDEEGGHSINKKFLDKKVLALVWDNTGSNIDLGYRIANTGYPVVLCNVTNLYFDLAYEIDPGEPGLHWGGFQGAMDPYVMAPFDLFKTSNFDWHGRLHDSIGTFPGKQRLIKTKEKNILGLQAQLWTETVKGASMMEYYVLPKLFAFAEKAWAKAPSWELEPDVRLRNQGIMAGWNELANRIGHYELSKIDASFDAFNYRIAPPGGVVENGILTANVAFPGMVIRYTTDGSEPSTESPTYSQPVRVNGSVKIRAFNQKGRGSRVLKVPH